MRLMLLLTLIVLALGACRTTRGLQPEDIPTRASVEDMATALPLTQNAPPAPYDRPVTRFDRVDNRLNELVGWRYVVQLEFEGEFAETGQEANASARAEVWFNQVADARRVSVSTSGEMIGQAEDTTYEAVRLGPDSFLIRDGACQSNASQAAETAAALNAGELIGGATEAVPAGRRAVINGEEVYLYAFEGDDLVLPSIRAAEGGQVTLTSGEIWIAPARNAVVRFYLNLDVENVVIFDRQLPVSGQVVIRYDLYDVGVENNITVPFGC